MSIGLNRSPFIFISLSKKLFVTTNVRCLATHWNPKFKKLRANKFVKVFKLKN